MKKLVCILLALAVFLPSVALANDGYLGGEGETVYPLYNTDVEMTKEIIDIRVKNDISYYTCRFYFKNTGKRSRILMGFPCMKEYYKQEDDYREGDDANLYRFKSYVNGARIPVRLKKGVKTNSYNSEENYYPVWYTWNVRFEKGQKKTIKNTYWCYNSGDSSGYRSVGYVLKTGACWKNNIGKVLARMRLGDMNPYLVDFAWDETPFMPDYYTENGTLIWNKTNLEPTEDIWVNFETINEYFFEELADEKLEDMIDDDNSNDQFLSYYASYDSLLRLFRHFKQKHYRSVIWWGNRIRKKYGTKEPIALKYCMGVAYYQRHLYGKAMKELDKCGDIGLYYKALCLKGLGRTEAYKDCLTNIAGMEQDYSGLALWAKSRLKDMEKAA